MFVLYPMKPPVGHLALTHEGNLDKPCLSSFRQSFSWCFMKRFRRCLICCFIACLQVSSEGVVEQCSLKCEGGSEYKIFGLGSCSLFAPLVLMQPRAVFGLNSKHRSFVRQTPMDQANQSFILSLLQGLSSLVPSAVAHCQSWEALRG